MKFAVVAALPLLAAAQDLTIRDATFQGRDAWVLANGVMQVSMVKGGGFIGEMRLTTGDPKRDINPLRIPHYPTIDPNTYVDAKHNAIYGTGPHRWLHSGYMGHYLCFPIYGPPSSIEEGAGGLGNHGEAALVVWRQVSQKIGADAAELIVEADLPKSQFKLRRRVTMPRGATQFTVEEEAENLAAFDRPVQWMQHATFGPPFIEPGKSVLRISAVRSGTEGEPVKERVMPATPRSGSYTALRLDPARAQEYFVMSNPGFAVSVGYVFPGDAHPWVGDWMENRRNTEAPWNGQTVARGIEFGSSPYAEGLKKAIERGSMFDTPTYLWIAARQKYRTQYTAFLTETPGTSISDVIKDGAMVRVVSK